MPYTDKQKRFFGAELGRMKRGESTETGMTHAQLVEGIHAPTRKKKKKHVVHNENRMASKYS